MTMPSGYLLLQPRALPIALAHRMVLQRPGSVEAEICASTYASLSPGDKLRCRAELHRCQMAMRGQSTAELLMGESS